MRSEYKLPREHCTYLNGGEPIDPAITGNTKRLTLHSMFAKASGRNPVLLLSTKANVS